MRLTWLYNTILVVSFYSFSKNTDESQNEYSNKQQ